MHPRKRFNLIHVKKQIAQSRALGERRIHLCLAPRLHALLEQGSRGHDVGRCGGCRAPSQEQIRAQNVLHDVALHRHSLVALAHIQQHQIPRAGKVTAIFAIIKAEGSALVPIAQIRHDRKHGTFIEGPLERHRHVECKREKSERRTPTRRM